MDSSGQITLTCTGAGNISYDVTLSSGQSGNELSRYLSSSSVHLSYNVYKDTSHTQVFGDGAGGTYTFSNTWSVPSGTSSRVGSFYGAIPSGQNVAPGAFTDSLVVMISY